MVTAQTACCSSKHSMAEHLHCTHTALGWHHRCSVIQCKSRGHHRPLGLRLCKHKLGILPLCMCGLIVIVPAPLLPYMVACQANSAGTLSPMEKHSSSMFTFTPAFFIVHYSQHRVCLACVYTCLTPQLQASTQPVFTPALFLQHCKHRECLLCTHTHT